MGPLIIKQTNERYRLVELSSDQKHATTLKELDLRAVKNKERTKVKEACSGLQRVLKYIK